jgi:hypothetical protein
MSRVCGAPSLDPVDLHGEDALDTYLIFRRNGWRSGEEMREAAVRSTAEGERLSENVAWIRSYVLSERDGSFGTVCVFQASSPEAIRRHATAAGLPVDEIVAVAGTVVVRPDPTPASL